jgi:hypothetical protein
VIPVAQLPEGATPGTWLRLQIEEDEIVAIELDAAETKAVRGRVANKMEQLRQRARHLKPEAPSVDERADMPAAGETPEAPAVDDAPAIDDTPERDVDDDTDDWW